MRLNSLELNKFAGGWFWDVLSAIDRREYSLASAQVRFDLMGQQMEHHVSVDMFNEYQQKWKLKYVLLSDFIY